MDALVSVAHFSSVPPQPARKMGKGRDGLYSPFDRAHTADYRERARMRVCGNDVRVCVVTDQAAGTHMSFNACGPSGL